MAQQKRTRPQKALTRKDFRYKRDWRYHKEEKECIKEEEEFTKYDEGDGELFGIVGCCILLLTIIIMVIKHPFGFFDDIWKILGFLGYILVGIIFYDAGSKLCKSKNQVHRNWGSLINISTIIGLIAVAYLTIRNVV